MPTSTLANNLAAIILLPGLLSISCQSKNDLKLCDNEVSVLDINLLEQILVDKLEEENAMGYAYVIAKDGQPKITGSGGQARSQQDGGLPFTANTIMHIASVSKTITSAAVLRLLEQKNLTVNEKIYPYLPSSWNINEATKAITFRDLLNHSTSFPVMGEGSTRYDSLRAYAERGISLSIKKYSNINHAYFRIIIPLLWNKYRPAPGYGYDEYFFASVYEKYIREEIFQPLGISGYLNTLGMSTALAYESKNNENGKLGPDDLSLNSGAYGWQMSATETARFWAYLWFSEDILNESSKNSMKLHKSGLWNTQNGVHGTYYGKRGLWHWVDNNGIYYSYETFVILYPNNYQVTLLVNSTLSQTTGNILKDAYEDSFVNECL